MMSAFVLAALTAASLHAETPQIHAEGMIELETGWSLDEAEAEDGVIAATIEFAAEVELGVRWSLVSGLTLEPVVEPDAPASFSSEGLYLDTFAIRHATPRFSVQLGKFSPAFGTAWDVTPGVFGTEAAEMYELAEYVGLGADTVLTALPARPDGVWTLSGALVTADRSPFSNSLLRQRGRLTLDDGGAGNTSGLESATLALDGYDTLLEGLHLHLAVRRLAVDDASADAETAFAAGAVWSGEWQNGTAWSLNTEWAAFDHVEGDDERSDIATIGAGLQRGPWRFGLSHARIGSELGADGHAEHIAQLSLGHDFPTGLAIDIGLKRHASNDEHAYTLGTIVSLAFE